MVETGDELLVLLYFSAKFRSVIEDEVEFIQRLIHFW
jgi:hypothetical protein